MSTRFFLFLTLFLGVGLVACQTTNTPEPTPAATNTAVASDPIPLPTLTATASATETPVPTPTVSGYFQQVIGVQGITDEAGNYVEGEWVIQGITADGELGTRPWPSEQGLPKEFDYALATDRPLQVTHDGRGAGPSTMSVGTLQVADAEITQWETVADDVVNARWHPNGRDLAYIAATADTYELRFAPAEGETRVLATDVPHTLGFSPDGRYIGFTRESRYDGLSGTPGIYVVDVETGVETQVSPEDRAGFGGTGDAYAPIWSPDSQSFLISVPYLDLPDGSVRENGLVWADVSGNQSAFWSFEALDTAVQNVDPTLCIAASGFVLSGAELVMPAGPCLDPQSQGLGMGVPPASALVRIVLDSATGTAKTVGITPLFGGPHELLRLVGWSAPNTAVWVTVDQFAQSVPIN